MKSKTLTGYLAIFLIVCIILDGILLRYFTDKPWWNNWMIMAPNLYMILGAFYCHFMIKHVEADQNKLVWLMEYKGIKLLLSVAAIVLYMVFVKEGSRGFTIITASAYIVALAVETAIYAHFMNKQDRKKG